ncbi:FecR domain-containing protein [Metapseudomonas otitidis]|uniref:FecR domain-containing protein n=1 Tax=Metapseudomonas otitidis TaxID=319939 RepID=UPI0008ED5DC9|nr:FecR domain-containing protein [Pseudomonas otitidis]SFA57243.1 FecR family protein [Pseudomonas otitidis]
MSAGPIERRIAREAARWFVRLQAGASEAVHAECARWRASHEAHERAWQIAEQFHQRLQGIPPAIAGQALGRPATADRRALLKLLALAALAAPCGVIGYRATPWRSWVADERTAVGERREIQLPDGTQVVLNTASALDLAFDEQRRLLRLHAGEIQVSTAVDASGRPFWVQTREGLVRPVGTRFTVRQREGLTQVAVQSGAVELKPVGAPSATLLGAGYQSEFDDLRMGEVRPLQPGTDDWVRGVLRAEGLTLGAFIEELGRYRPGVLRCDPAVAGLRISGAFQLADTGQVLESLARTLPVDIHYRTRYWVTLAPRT